MIPPIADLGLNFAPYNLLYGVCLKSYFMHIDTENLSTLKINQNEKIFTFRSFRWNSYDSGC